MSPFCEYKSNNNLWVCTKCNNTLNINEYPERPITSCKISYQILGLKDYRPLFFIDRESYDLNRISVTTTQGVGTELKKILQKFGWLIKLNYAYNQKFMMMNNWGPDICDNKKRRLIVNWLIEEAVKLNIQHDEEHINLLLTKAINNFRQKT